MSSRTEMAVFAKLPATGEIGLARVARRAFYRRVPADKETIISFDVIIVKAITVFMALPAVLRCRTAMAQQRLRSRPKSLARGQQHKERDGDSQG